jgi:RNA polymerase sigma factor (TIGR02999 family)
MLNAVEAGEPLVTERLIPVVYDELRALAARRMAREPPGQTLQATALVHEAYLRLLGGGGQQWQNRRHFFAAAAEAMRRILIENARRKRSEKHGGALQRVDWAEVSVATAADDDQLVAIHDALEQLEVDDPTCAELVKLRFFIGLTGQEAAQALGIPERTATRLWAYARARLLQKLAR